MSMPVLIVFASTLTLNKALEGLAGSHLILPFKPLKEPLVLIPKFFIVKVTESSASTGLRSIMVKAKRKKGTDRSKNLFMRFFIANYKPTMIFYLQLKCS